MMFNILVMTDENLAFLPDNPVTQKIALVESLSVINNEPKNRGRIAEKIVKFDLQLNTKKRVGSHTGAKKIFCLNNLSDKINFGKEASHNNGHKIASFSVIFSFARVEITTKVSNSKLQLR